MTVGSRVPKHGKIQASRSLPTVQMTRGHLPQVKAPPAPARIAAASRVGAPPASVRGSSETGLQARVRASAPAAMEDAVPDDGLPLRRGGRVNKSPW